MRWPCWFSLGVSTAAQADPAETRRGITVKSDDGRFEASVGGRIHFDGNLIDGIDSAPFGSSAPAVRNTSSFFFRRIYITLKGKLFGVGYKIERYLASKNATDAPSISFQDAYLSTRLGPGEIILRQTKRSGVWGS